MKWGLWSTTASSNSATPPDGWPEGQAPSTVNDCAREMMASIATGISDIQFVDLGLAPTQTGGTTFTVSGNWANVLHYGRRIKASDGANTFYGTIISASQTVNTGVQVRFDAGNAPLDSSLSAFAVGFPSQQNGANPENVYRNKNFFDNSQFDIWQRGGGPFSFSSVNATAKCTADRFVVFLQTSAGPTISVTRGERSAAASNVPTLAQCGVLLNNSLVVSVGPAVGSLAATDNCLIAQTIEGYNWRQLVQKPITLSFWVNSTITGTYCASIGLGAQEAVLEYSISSVATWEKKTLTFPPSPTGFAWDLSTGGAVACRWALAAGTTLQGGAGNWTATAILATSNQIQLLSNASSTFKLAAVKLEEGTQATPLTPIDYARELATCQRYLIAYNGQAVGFVASSSQCVFAINYASMRDASLSASTNVPLTSLFIIGQGAAQSVSAINSVAVARNSLLLAASVVGTPLTNGLGVRINTSAGVTTAWLIIKSEP